MMPTELETDIAVAPGKRMILAVDDQPVNIRLLYEILKSDYEVCMATGGQAALAFCETRLPDLILLDVLMPEVDGYEVCRTLKADERTREIPVIFVTAQDDPNEEARGLNAGAADFISKPINSRVVLARVGTQMTLIAQAEALRSLAMIDGPTGIANRRQFDITLAVEWRQSLRSGKPLCMLLVDIDYFKPYNDYYGHPAGDACIQAVASVLKKSFNRPLDVVARYGGDEFACVLPDTTLEGAYRKALELERAVRALGLPHEKSAIAAIATVSIGVASAVPEEGDLATELIAAADRQLYKAKDLGRGQVQ